MLSKRHINFDLNDMSCWPSWFTISVAIIIFTITLQLFNTLLIAPKKQLANTLQSSINSVHQEYKTNKLAIGQLDKTRKEVKALKAIHAELQTFLPTDISMPQLIDDIYQTAHNNNIIFTSFTPEKDITTEHYTIKPISLQATVKFINMATFIEDIVALRRIMTINNISFDTISSVKNTTSATSKNNGSSLKMTAQLRTYMFNTSTITDN